MTGAERQRLKHAVDQARRQHIYQHSRVCSCGAPFHPVNPNQRFCTKRCANRNHYDRTRGHA